MSNKIFCTVCQQAQTQFLLHSDAPVFTCAACTHAFTDVAAIEVPEDYGPAYYETTHKKWFENPDIKLFDRLIKLMPKTAKSILDVGCGNGNFLRHIEPRGAFDRLVGIDLCPNQSTDRIHYIQGNIDEMPNDEKFDVIVSLAVIEHVGDPVIFAQALSKKCKEGGMVIVMTVASESLIYAVARMAYKIGLITPAKRLYSAHHLQHFTKKSLQLTLEKAHLKITKQFLHAPPLKAVDTPVLGPFKHMFFVGGLLGLYFLQAIFRRPHLQTSIGIRLINEDVSRQS